MKNKKMSVGDAQTLLDTCERYEHDWDGLTVVTWKDGNDELAVGYFSPRPDASDVVTVTDRSNPGFKKTFMGRNAQSLRERGVFAGND
jgi:hypothetical protein